MWRHGGLGLRLALAKHLDASWRSRFRREPWQGRGTTETVSLPAAGMTNVVSSLETPTAVLRVSEKTIGPSQHPNARNCPRHRGGNSTDHADHVVAVHARELRPARRASVGVGQGLRFFRFVAGAGCSPLDGVALLARPLQTGVRPCDHGPVRLVDDIGHPFDGCVRNWRPVSRA